MIIRSKKPSENYTIVSNALIENEKLDWKDLGMLIFLLSKPDHWQVSLTHLASQRKTGVDGIKSSIKALKEAGYIQIKRKANGKVDWMVFDYPQVVIPLMATPQVEKPQVEKPHVDNPLLVSTDIQVSTEIDSNEGFDFFWNHYGKVGNKQKAFSAWKRLSKKNQDLAATKLESFRDGLPEFQCRGKNIHASTYLNSKRWEDESSNVTEESNIGYI